MNLGESKESYVWVCRNKKRETGNHETYYNIKNQNSNEYSKMSD